ncbi:LamG domain-containing protein [Akkermansiaceae bacterium]|nr:LamG domain-containing protein [Akkermansiaceae bacterium]
MKLKSVITLAASALITSSPGALLLHWNLDDAAGTTAADSSGNGYDGGYLTGAPTWTASGGADGGFVSFATADHAFQTTSFATIDLGAFTAFSISTWIRTTSTANDTVAVLRTGVGNSYYSSKIQGSTARMTARNTTDLTLNSGQVINDGAWHHVVAVFRGTDDREIFVDGVSAGTNTVDVPFLTPTGFSIGALDRADGNVVDEYTGDIDDVQLYDHVVSAADAAFLFANPGTAIAIPEPTSAMMLGLALGLGFVRRR